MKYLAALIILLFLISSNETLHAQWVQTNGPYRGVVNSFAVSGTNLFAGTVGGGVYLSTNNGTSWAAVNNGFPSSDVMALAVSGTNLFAGTDDGGVYLSTNNGTSWTVVNNGLTNSYVLALEVNGTNLFAGTLYTNVWKRPLSELTAVTKEINDLPKDFTLSQNYPNPFNPNTIISYSLPSSSNIKLLVYNTLGQLVNTLESGYKSAGNYSLNFNASDLSSGIYFYKLEAGQFSQVKKMILLK